MKQSEGEILKSAIRGKYPNMEEAAAALGVVRKTLYNYFNLNELSNEVKEEIYTKIGLKITQNVYIKDDREAALLEDSISPSFNEKRLARKNSKEKVLDYYQAGANAATKSTGEILPVSKPVGKLNIGELFKDSQFAIRVSGNSMIPNYPPGCIIGIRLIDNFIINPGSVYVIEAGDDLWIKRLYYKNNDRSNEELVLMSDNKMKEESGERQGEYCYPSFLLHKSEIRNIFRVTGVFKSNTLTLIEN